MSALTLPHVPWAQHPLGLVEGALPHRDRHVEAPLPGRPREERPRVRFEVQLIPFGVGPLIAVPSAGAPRQLGCRLVQHPRGPREGGALQEFLPALSLLTRGGVDPGGELGVEAAQADHDSYTSSTPGASCT